MKVKFERDGDVAIVTLNRPEKRNALDNEMILELNRALRDLGDAKVVVLRGAGKDFCAGHDLNEVLKDADYHFRLCRGLMHTFRSIPQVVIAQVQGHAVAGGCQLVAVSDLAVASENSRFGLVGIRLGLFCYTPTVFVCRCVNTKRAFELAFTGETIDAKTALEWGLVNRVVPSERLEEETMSLAEKIARHDLSVIGRAKRFFYSQMNMGEFEALSLALREIVLNANMSSTREKILKFLNK